MNYASRLFRLINWVMALLSFGSDPNILKGSSDFHYLRITLERLQGVEMQIYGALGDDDNSVLIAFANIVQLIPELKLQAICAV